MDDLCAYVIYIANEREETSKNSGGLGGPSPSLLLDDDPRAKPSPGSTSTRRRCVFVELRIPFFAVLPPYAVPFYVIDLDKLLPVVRR
jgi:hypothetical protein